MLAILYDRIRPDERMLFERAEALREHNRKEYRRAGTEGLRRRRAGRARDH